MAIKIDIHMVETCAGKSLDELKALCVDLDSRLRQLMRETDIMDEGHFDHIASQMSAVSEVLRWHGLEYAQVTVAGGGSEYRWVRVDESNN
jgi:hypothetical protein